MFSVSGFPLPLCGPGGGQGKGSAAWAQADSEGSCRAHGVRERLGNLKNWPGAEARAGGMDWRVSNDRGIFPLEEEGIGAQACFGELRQVLPIVILPASRRHCFSDRARLGGPSPGLRSLGWGPDTCFSYRFSRTGVLTGCFPDEQQLLPNWETYQEYRFSGS